ncbi:MAG: CtsR family transcriptional regulator [Clostridia bacterium]|nr:CtsR family transcriptional regulator [Clostridia bacterium]
MRMSDAIAAYILQMLEEGPNGSAELQRNTLAEQLGCVPSQINYVLTSRFTPEQGYVVESRRGGGGYIRISRVQMHPTTTPLMHIVNALGEQLTPAAAAAILENLIYQGALSDADGRLMAAALSDRAYRDVPIALRDRLRATMMKQLLTAVNLKKE